MRGPGVLGDWFGIWVVWKFGWSKVVNVTPDYGGQETKYNLTSAAGKKGQKLLSYLMYGRLLGSRYSNSTLKRNEATLANELGKVIVIMV